MDFAAAFKDLLDVFKEHAGKEAKKRKVADPSNRLTYLGIRSDSTLSRKEPPTRHAVEL